MLEVLACSRLSDSGEDAKVKGTRGSNCKALTGNVVVAYGRWWLTRGSRTWRFDCFERNIVDEAGMANILLLKTDNLLFTILLCEEKIGEHCRPSATEYFTILSILRKRQTKEEKNGQGHPTTVFWEISVRSPVERLKFSRAQKQLKISKIFRGDCLLRSEFRDLCGLFT